MPIFKQLKRINMSETENETKGPYPPPKEIMQMHATPCSMHVLYLQFEKYRLPFPRPHTLPI